MWLFLLVLNTTALTIGNSNAQIVSGNAFLKGNFVELGIAPCGKFGSEVAAPAGYHPNMSSGALGFVADAAGDGWTTGTPNFCGDYFLPGSPEEGFSVRVNGVNYGNFEYCSGAQITGSVTGYTLTGTDVSAVWEGNITAQNIAVTATSRIPLGGKYILTTVQICNMGAATATGVYYMRNVDPDNEQPWTGDFTTQQQIVLQQPTSAECRALVRATGTSLGCYLGLGSKDPRARVSFGGFSNRNPLDVWNGAGGLTGTLGATATGDEAISIAFNLGDLAPGACETVSFVYILNAADLDAALNATANPQYFANGNDITTTGSAAACAGSPVTLSISNGGSFTWSWSPSTFLNTTSGATVICTPTSDIVYTVTGTSACSPSVTQFITVNLVTPPTIITQPASQTVCSGTPATLSVNATTSSGTLTYQWQFNGVNIPGATGATYTIPSTTLANAGNYTVMVTGGCGLLSDVATLTVLPSSAASVSVVATPSSSVCAGTVVTFTATPTNGGSSPSYQWFLNGNPIAGATSATYSSSSLATGDVVTVQMNSSSTCATPPSATSAPITMTSVNIPGLVTASSTTICSGESVTFNANPSGTNPAGTQYTYFVNGVAVAGPTTTSTYTTSTLNNGDVVTVQMTATVGGTSTFSAGPVSIPSSGTATPYPSTINVTGMSGTITDVKVRFTNMTHTWMSDIDVLLRAPGGQQSTVFSDQGGSADFVSPNSITFQTGGAAWPAGNITGTHTLAPVETEADNYPAPGPGAGTFPANFGVFNGLNPNGTWSLFVFDDVGGDSGNIPTWTLIITTSGVTCSVTSSPITMSVGSGPASVSVTPSATSICTGTSVTFNATAVNGGTPTYQWQINGVNVTGATGASFTSSTLNDGDVITVVMTSSLSCVTGSPATSSPITMTVNAAPVVTFTLPATICSTNASFTMNGTPAGGVYTGPGVSGDVFSPGTSGGPGVKTITYTYTSGGCSVSVTATITVTSCAFPPPLPPVPIPAYLIVEGQNTNTLRLRFPDADNNETGYEIYRSTNGTDFTLHATTGPYNVFEIHYFDSINTEPDRPYYYIVRTLKGVRRSGFTNSAYDYTYPLAPTIVSIGDACLGGSGRITASGTHDSQEYRWYLSENAQHPIYEAGSEPYRGNTLTTPFMTTPAVYWVTAKGYRYESKPRVAASVGIRQRPVANLLNLSPVVMSCDASYTFAVEFYAGMTYSWYNEFGVLVGTTESNEFTISVNGTYRVKVSDGYCESYSPWVTLKLNYKPEATILQGGTAVFCQSGTISAKEIQGATYTWTKDGSVVGTGVNLNVSETGTYTLNVTQYGCTNASEINVLINKLPTTFAITAADAAICPGGETVITATSVPGAARYLWLRNGRNFRATMSNMVTVRQGGTYAVVVYFDDFCQQEAAQTVVIEEHATPKVFAEITPDTRINLNNELGLPYSSVVWFVNGEEVPAFANQASIRPTVFGRYQAIVTYATGCQVPSTSVYFAINGTDTDETNPNEARFLLYPNPTKGDLYLTMSAKEDVTVQILDQLGRTLIENKFTGEEVSNTVKLDLSELPAGVFMVKISSNGITTVRKITRD